ncbi:MAG: beta-ketoacyl synthase chain length factor [Pseudomonadota bacterium]
MHFTLDSWAALADGLTTREQWLDWFERPRPLGRRFSPDLSWMPASLRRRVSPLGRVALNVLAACLPAEACPVVFASRYGDLEGIAGLLAQLHEEGIVSPMGFSLSVHNAAIGVYSIARQDRISTTCIAANADLIEVACVEAMGWMASGERQVLLVCCEDPAPPPYRADEGATDFRYAWACRLRATKTEGVTLRLADGGVKSEIPSRGNTSNLDPLAFMAGVRGSSLMSETGRYEWRHD